MLFHFINGLNVALKCDCTDHHRKGLPLPNCGYMYVLEWRSASGIEKFFVGYQSFRADVCFQFL